jgi:hypothetical protein
VHLVRLDDTENVRAVVQLAEAVEDEEPNGNDADGTGAAGDAEV